MESPAPPGAAARAAGRGLRLPRQPRVPAPVARLRRGREGRRQAGRPARRARLQPLRGAGDPGQSLRAAGPRRARPDRARVTARPAGQSRMPAEPTGLNAAAEALCWTPDIPNEAAVLA